MAAAEGGDNMTGGAFAVVEAAPNPAPNTRPVCNHFLKPGHEMATCYQLVRYPNWWGERARVMVVPQAALQIRVTDEEEAKLAKGEENFGTGGRKGNTGRGGATGWAHAVLGLDDGGGNNSSSSANGNAGTKFVSPGLPRLTNE